MGLPKSSRRVKGKQSEAAGVAAAPRPASKVLASTENLAAMGRPRDKAMEKTPEKKRERILSDMSPPAGPGGERPSKKARLRTAPEPLGKENVPKTSPAKAVKAAKVVEVVEVMEEEQLTDERRSTLCRLFAAVDLVLSLRAGRAPTTRFEELVSQVEASAGLTLTEERLQQVVSICDGMVEAVWVGAGRDAYMLIEQRDEAGKRHQPQGHELASRRERFAQRACADNARRPLPSRPEAEAAAAPTLKKVVLPAEKGPAPELPPLKSGGSAAERLQAIRARVAAKEALLAEEESVESEIRALGKRIGACEDALTARSVLLNHFGGRLNNRTTSAPSWRLRSAEVPLDKAELGRTAPVRENELFASLCSLSWADQCVRKVSPEEGKAAIAKLREVGAGTWFRVDKGDRCGEDTWHRVSAGAEAVREALLEEIRALQEEKAALMAKSRRQQAVWVERST